MQILFAHHLHRVEHAWATVSLHTDTSLIRTAVAQRVLTWLLELILAVAERP